MKTAVIFGGTGFIGTHFAFFLLSNKLVNKIYLVDLVDINSKFNSYRNKHFLSDTRISFIYGDVRKSLRWFNPDGHIIFIANFAAIHREPGHVDVEYFETNLMGAENVCAWAETVDCKTILFTSSISPYGVSESIKNESTIPIPDTAYGSSKLIAEKIHQIWQARDDANRRLVIVRPGVVFGPGEGGNVSRLIKAVLRRYFFYLGNENTRKAGVYVKELCNALWWVLQRQKLSGEHVSLFNMSMNPAPSIRDYVNSVCSVAGVRRFVPRVPFLLLMTVACLIDAIARPLKISHPFSPVRINKLVRSNNILPIYLLENGYQYLYSLDDAFSDWMQCCPEEWK